MQKELADALLDFYQTILKPEFDALKAKNEEHDQRFSDILGHFDAIYRRLERVEDELLMMNNRLGRLEDAIKDEKSNRLDLELRVKEIKSQMELLQARLEMVERHLENTPG